MAKLTKKRKIGNLGENLACRFLIKHGFDIIERNYLMKCGEIDIITKKEGVIHFVEVKTVSQETTSGVSDETNNDGCFRPEDNLHPWKLKRIAKTIQIYLAQKDITYETNWVFDVITVYIDKKRLISKINIIENVIM